MFRNRKTLWIVIGGSLVLALAIVAGAIVTTGIARAQTAREWLSGGPQDGGFVHGGPGGPGFPGGPGGWENDTNLAQALGITADQLQAAREAAYNDALDQAVANGDLTQAQADAIRTLRSAGNGFGFHFGFPGMRAGRAGIDMDALLAKELNISVDELNAARQKAADAALADAVSSGKITQEQADMIKAHQALRKYVDREALTAKALGISVDELQSARQAGTSMSDLLAKAGLTEEQFRTALQDAYKAEIQQAVEDGVITQAQADQILSGDNFGFGGPWDGGFGGHGRRGPGGGWGPMDPNAGGPNGGGPNGPATTPTPSSGTNG